MTQPTPEQRARNLLTWATLVALVALVILMIDFTIKREIVGSRGKSKNPLLVHDDPGNNRDGGDGVDDDAARSAAPSADEDRPPGTNNYPVGSADGQSIRDEV